MACGMGASPMHSRRPAALREPEAAGAAGCMGEAPMPRIHVIASSGDSLPLPLLSRAPVFPAARIPTMHFGVCSPLDRADVVRAAGWDYVEAGVPELLQGETADDA